MDTGRALEIVHGLATKRLRMIEALSPFACNVAEAQDALDTVQDFIVNNFEEDDAPVPAHSPNAANAVNKVL
jgi:hypothetical protein